MFVKIFFENARLLWKMPINPSGMDFIHKPCKTLMVFLLYMDRLTDILINRARLPALPVRLRLDIFLVIYVCTSKKSSGPSTEPWGTPNNTGTPEEHSPSSTTAWVRPPRKEPIQLRVLPLSP